MPSESDIQSEFQKFLGRAPTSSEVDFFNSLFQSGDLKPFELGQFLQGIPEAQQTRLTQQGKQLEGYLGASDQEILGRAADTARSQAQRLGRGDTSAIGSQIASAGRDLAVNRSQQLAAFYGGGLGDISSDYRANSTDALGRAYGLGDERRKFQQEKDVYNLQKNDYQDALNAYYRRSRRQGLLGLGGAALGGALGGLAGGPMGAFAGGSIGSRLGGI